MKPLNTLILIFLSLAGAGSSLAQEQQQQSRLARLERDTIGAAAQLSIEATLKTSCDKYHLLSNFNVVADGLCRGEVDHMFKLMDIDGRIAFSERLDMLTAEPQVWEWLKLLKKAMIKSYAAKKYFSLWDGTVRFTKGDTRRALEYIAVIFQNSKAPEDVIARLQRANAPQEAIDAYEKVNLFLIPESPMLADFPMFNPYPTGMTEGLPRYLYHFYVPAYLAMRMKEDGAGEQHAFYMPFAMDEAYSILMQHKANAELAWKNTKEFFAGEKLSAGGDPNWRAAKTYLGYVGSLFGLGEIKQAVSIQEFTARFKKSSSKMMKGFYSASH